MTRNPNLNDYELQLDGHARAIGHVCIVWSHMECMLDLLVHDLIAGNGARQPDTMQVSDCITANTDLRDKVAIAISLGHIRQPNEEWFIKLQTCLNEIDNPLRNARNRLTHDVWAISDPTPMRLHKRTKITKPQAFQRVLSVSEIVLVKLDEIWELHASIKRAIEMITILRINFRMPDSVSWL